MWRRVVEATHSIHCFKQGYEKYRWTASYVQAKLWKRWKKENIGEKSRERDTRELCWVELVGTQVLKIIFLSPPPSSHKRKTKQSTIKGQGHGFPSTMPWNR